MQQGASPNIIEIAFENFENERATNHESAEIYQFFFWEGYFIRNFLQQETFLKKDLLIFLKIVITK